MQWQGEIKWVRLVKECLHNEYGRWTYIARKVNRYKVWFRYKSSGSRASHNWSLYWRWTWENWSLLGWPRATGRRSSRSGIRQVNIAGRVNRYECWCRYKHILSRASPTWSHLVITLNIINLAQLAMFVGLAEGYWPSERQVGDPTGK